MHAEYVCAALAQKRSERDRRRDPILYRRRID
jgi:hypothetical protein